jgi:Phosphomannomutase
LEKRGLKKLKREILKRKANGGAAFDSDADRIIFFDEKGNFIEPSKIFALLVLNFLRKDKNFRFVTTEFLNQKIKEKIQKEKGKLVYSPTGYGYFYLKMREEKAVFGSEHTGHFYFKDFDYHDDGLITLILVLNLLSLKEKPFSQIIDEFETNPSFFMNFKSLSLKSFYVLKYLEEIARKYKVKTFENLKIITKDWLIIVRISGTSNLIRFYLEKL